VRALVPLFACGILSGCAAARWVGPAVATPPVSRGPVAVVIEPFFESAEWKQTQRAESVETYPSTNGYGAYGPYGGFGGGPQRMTVYRDVPEKPSVARIPALNAEHQTVIQEVARMRPAWQVLSTAALTTHSGPVDLVRVLVAEIRPGESDRTLKNFTSAIGLGIPAIFLTVHETQVISGTLTRYQTDAENLRNHLIRYPSQPDYAVDTRGLAPTEQPFALEVEYEEGVFGPEKARDSAVVDGFAHALAVSVVAVVEGVKP